MQNAPVLPPRPSFVGNRISIQSIAKTTISPKGPSANEDSRAFQYSGISNLSITLIRRDPGSGGQWNVGKILFSKDIGLNTSLGKTEPSLPREEDMIFLKISSIGYNKFVEWTDEGTSHQVPSDHNSVQTTKASHDSKSTAESSKERPCFQRQLLIRNARPLPNNLSSQRDSFISSQDNRRSSDYPTTARSLPAPSPLVSPEPSHNQPNAYTFTSPWNGTCEFSTGIAGRSLKCKHTLPFTTTSLVSELRFNLPSSNIFNTAPSKRPPLSTPFRSSRSSSTSFPSPSLVNRPSNQYHYNVQSGSSHLPYYDDSSSDSERLDLSLGQEHAGGGIRGNRAKLGKLIVQDEGLKMLDLVVAANMGVWWRVYGRGKG